MGPGEGRANCWGNRFRGKGRQSGAEQHQEEAAGGSLRELWETAGTLQTFRGWVRNSLFREYSLLNTFSHPPGSEQSSDAAISPTPEDSRMRVEETGIPGLRTEGEFIQGGKEGGWGDNTSLSLGCRGPA